MKQWKALAPAIEATWQESATGPLVFLDAENETRQRVLANPEETANTQCLIPLVAHRLLTVRGQDAVKFLQGQLTCDLKNLEENALLWGAHCNPKGRMISSFVVARCSEDSITLRVRDNISDSAFSALKKYIVFSKAEITSAERMAVVITGVNEWPQSLKALTPPQPGQVAALGDGAVLNHGNGVFELWQSEPNLRKLLPELRQDFVPVTSAIYDHILIAQGIAEVQAATQEEFIPQMLNYQLINAVSFKKGCYTGQEIVARMQYRGQLKKHTYRAWIASATPIPVGTKLYRQGDAAQQGGIVVASAPAAGGQALLVVTSAEIHALDRLTHNLEKTPVVLQWRPLPYAIP